ncbi:hypothetical protein JHD49_10250 [Sulfurimonas sp. SAG-AH-194-C21]|nr:hypothetical protein [Sulfurimonas sp. SAG-AH-194-C21]MDF1884323.1 hypothetical protein [Sulfurimonas sp. SAG-AH-194-C21]
MQELIFKVEFLSDIVLPATSNTEGNIVQLDFIAGSNFLGMAAKEYGEYENSFDVFHSAKMRFGDATILNGGKQTYKMPLSFFHKKLENEIVFNSLIEDFSKLEQLKQFRNGYITKDKDISFIEYNYSQKSAYDKDNRRSLDKSMFGYSAMRRGSLWQFTLKYDGISSNDLERIKINLIGINRLGKSKSAQYGEVKISLSGENENIQNSTLKEEVVLYVKSRLSLIDEEGNPTYALKYLCEGLKEENIVYEKIQLRTSTFTPYNGVRQTKDYERICINKGSVIVLKKISQTQLASLENGIGAYLSEGFGEILVNPSFLDVNRFTFKESTKEQIQKEVLKVTDGTALFLQKRKNTQQEALNIANEVHDFIKENPRLASEKMNSQWGTIRSKCASEEDIYESVKRYITHGIAKEKWKGSKTTTLLAAIKNSANPREFTKLLSMQIPKLKSLQEDTPNEN